MKKQLSILSGAFCAAVCLFGAACSQAQTRTKPARRPTPIQTKPPTQPMPDTKTPLRGLLAADKPLRSGETITFTYSVINQSKAEQTLQFSSGQRFDLVITVTPTGDPKTRQTLWQMSREKMYTMSLGSVTFAPGETKTFTAAWKPDADTAAAGAICRAEAFLTPMRASQGGAANRPAQAALILKATKPAK